MATGNRFLDAINSCIGKVYCKAEAQKCVGRNVKEAELLLKKLFVAKWLVEHGEVGNIACFIRQNCDPTFQLAEPVETNYLLFNDGGKILFNDGSGFALQTT